MFLHHRRFAPPCRWTARHVRGQSQRAKPPLHLAIRLSDQNAWIDGLRKPRAFRHAWQNNPPSEPQSSRPAAIPKGSMEMRSCIQSEPSAFRLQVDLQWLGSTLQRPLRNPPKSRRWPRFFRQQRPPCCQEQRSSIQMCRKTHPRPTTRAKQPPTLPKQNPGPSPPQPLEHCLCPF